jgi:hypothetical protein
MPLLFSRPIDIRMCSHLIVIEITADLYLSYLSGNLLINHDKIDSCVADFDVSNTMLIEDYFESCGLVTPKIALHQPCLTSEECIGNLYCDFNEDINHCSTVCLESESGSNDTQNIANEGEFCDGLEVICGSNLICEYTQNICLPVEAYLNFAENETCTLDSDRCALGLICVSDDMQSETGVCKPLAQEGEACSYSACLLDNSSCSNCEFGFYCEGLSEGMSSGICKKNPSQQDPCGTTITNNDGFLNTYCSPYAYLTCVNGICTSIKLLGESCTVDEECDKSQDITCQNQVCSILNECN